MGKIIARIVEVRGISVKAELLELLPPYYSISGRVYQAPKINSFVKTKVGLDTIICQIKGEYYNEYYRSKTSSESDALKIKNSDKTAYYLDLNVIGYISNNNMIQGLRILPIVSANIEMLDDKDYSVIYKTATNEDIFLGKNLFDSSKDVQCNINKLFVSHIGIFGNTGSGKSNTLTAIMQQYMFKVFSTNTNKSKTIVFDLNNEYGKNSIIPESFKKIYNLKLKGDGDKIPLEFDFLSEDQMCIFLNATEKMQTPIIKQTYKLFNKIRNGNIDENYFKSLLESVILNSRVPLFKKIRFNLRNYLQNIDRFECFHETNIYYVDENGIKFYNGSNEMKNAIGNIRINIPTDALDLFMFCLLFIIARENDGGTVYEYISPLIGKYEKLKDEFSKVFDLNASNFDLFDNDKKMVVIQLGNVNNDLKEIIPHLISSIQFENQMNYKEQYGMNDTILQIVIDEAHNLLYEDETDRIHTAGLYIFEKIIKEGRKFATFLYIASQRPFDISNTIMSQLHNYFIHKLVNPNDIAKIRKTVAFMDEQSLDFITILGPGECIVSGTAITIPQFIKVNQVDKESRPNSDNIILIGANGIFNN